MEISSNDNTNSHILDDVYNFLGRFISYPSEEAHIAHTLWIAHAHLMDVWENTPRIAFLSPEPGSGKTRALEVTQLLVPNPIHTFNATAAYIIRRVGATDELPTLLLDEADTVFGDKAKRDNEDLRGLINAGHRKGATAGRCVAKGNTIVTEDFPAYCAVAMAGLGDLPDTILTRSIIVRMRKRKQSEVVEPFRPRVHGSEGESLRHRLGEWCDSIRELLVDVWPEMPAEITDRNADVWEPLISIADIADGMWPEIARDAAVTLVTLARRDGNASLGVRLLKDLRIIFGDEDRLATSTILQRLRNLDESPWNNLKGEPLNDRLLAHLLKQYEIESTTIRIGGKTPKGYLKRDFYDAWERYLLDDTVADVADVADICENREQLSTPVADVADVALLTNKEEGAPREERGEVGAVSPPPTSATSATSATEATTSFHSSDKRNMGNKGNTVFLPSDEGNKRNIGNKQSHGPSEASRFSVVSDYASQEVELPEPDFGDGIVVNGKRYASWEQYDNEFRKSNDYSCIESLLLDELEPDFGDTRC